ncbi:DUF664 domain-containing protein [Nonomuraea sp. NPDC050536]|uniref:mycothiol transferase n=1 Tax=Nonomuraea sp. NPDC050536 TaxID=3364366 RepID=UPI0037C9C673
MLEQARGAELFVGARVAEGSDYLKVLIDDGSTVGMPTPALSRETVGALVAAAHQRGRVAIAHALTAGSARMAAQAGADVLGHLFVDGPDPDLAPELAERGTTVIPIPRRVASGPPYQGGEKRMRGERRLQYRPAMTPPRIRPEFEAPERDQLVGWLDMQRAIIHWKCEGLSEEDAHRAVLPSSPLMTMAGLVSHMRWVEHTWFEVLFLGHPAEGPQFADEEDADLKVDGVPLAQLLDEYGKQCAISNEIVATHPLEAVGTHPDFRSAKANLRWMLIHMIEETARHAGHADVMRELLDGETGYY